MSGLAAFFTADHRSCDGLWAAVEAAVEAGDDAAARIRFAVFETAMSRHLRWEENVLFPAFEEATGMMDGPTGVMRAEHTQMRGMLDQMTAALDGGDLELLADHGDTLLMLIGQHNMKEEQMLYPMAEDALEEDWATLRQALQ